MSEKTTLLEFIQNRMLPKGVVITASTLLFEKGYLDSMNILTLIGYVENKTGRRLSDDEIVMKNFQSVDAVIKAFFHDK